MPVARKNIRSALKAALEARPFFSAKSIKAILDDGTEAKNREMSDELEERGLVIAIPPLLGSGKGAQAAGRALEHVQSFVRIRENVVINAGAAGAQLVHEECVDAIIATFLALGENASGDVFGLKPGNEDDQFTSLVEDKGLTTTAVFFTVPLSNPRTP